MAQHDESAAAARSIPTTVANMPGLIFLSFLTTALQFVSPMWLKLASTAVRLDAAGDVVTGTTAQAGARGRATAARAPLM